MRGDKAARRAFLPLVAGAMVAGACYGGLSTTNGAWLPCAALDERGRSFVIAALIVVALAAHGLALAWRRRSYAPTACLLVGIAALGFCRVVESDSRWMEVLNSLGVCSVESEQSPRLVWVEGIVVSTPRLDELAFRDALIACDSLEEDTLARFVPRTVSVRFNLEVHALIDGHGADTPVCATVRVVVDGADAGCVAGDRIRAKGWLRGFTTPTNPGGFDALRWSRSREIAGLLLIPSANLVERRADSSLSPTALLARWRAAIDASLRDAIGDQTRLDAAALIAASTTGANWPGLRSVSKAFAASGVQHLVAISGFNFAILAAVALWLVGRLRLAPRIGGSVLVILALLFIASIESEVSSARAALMGGSSALALFFGRSIPFGSMLGMAAIVIVAFDPLAASEPGFQLSFGAIFGLRYLTPHITRLLCCTIHGYGLCATILRRALTPVAAGIGAWVATAPIVALHFGSCPLWSVPCTLALSPSFAVMVISSNIAVAAQPICPPIGFAAGWISMVNARVILCVVRFCATLPGAATPASSVRTVSDPIAWHTRIDMIDVGNGSCYLIRSGNSAVIFDCGSLGATAVGSQTVVPALRALGVRSIDAIVISHPNIDHYGAIPEVVRAFAVPHVFVTPQFIEWTRRGDGAARAALRAANKAGALTKLLARGDVMNYGHTTWRVLHPGASDVFGDSNDSSLIIRIEGGDFGLLMVGDAAREACIAVLESPDVASLQGITVFELPHHGSFRPAAAALASRVASPFVFQSTGPARLAKDRWVDVLPKARRFVTARDRACCILVDGDGQVWTGCWTGWQYQWTNSGLVRHTKEIAPNTIETTLLLCSDEKGAAKDDGVADRAAARILNLDLEWSRLYRHANLDLWKFCRQWLAYELDCALPDNDDAVGPRWCKTRNFHQRTEDGKSLGDFIDEPFRPPDFDCGCAKSGVACMDFWWWILGARQYRRGRRGDLWHQQRKRHESCWCLGNASDFFGGKRY